MACNLRINGVYWGYMNMYVMWAPANNGISMDNLLISTGYPDFFHPQ